MAVRTIALTTKTTTTKKIAIKAIIAIPVGAARMAEGIV